MKSKEVLNSSNEGNEKEHKIWPKNGKQTVRNPKKRICGTGTLLWICGTGGGGVL